MVEEQLASFSYPIPALILFIVIPILIIVYKRSSPNAGAKLPPGTYGLPILGENFQFHYCGWKGRPQRFVLERMKKFSTQCFKTNILGTPVAVLCGASGNKFLFCNEGKMVQGWWPDSMKKFFPKTADLAGGAKQLREMAPHFLKPEGLQKYIGRMDIIAKRHFDSEWNTKDQVTVYPLSQRYTFWLACQLYMSIEDPKHIEQLSGPFHHFTSGLFSLPINLPGTQFNRGIKASRTIRNEIRAIIKQKKEDLAGNKGLVVHDMLSHLMAATDEEGRHISEPDLVNMIITLLLTSFDPGSSTITAVVKFLGEIPSVYELVYKEQMEIASSKAEGELLGWDDIQKMKYSWNVVCEALRLLPPLQGSFRKALNEFNYAGFQVPNGWKLYWSAYTTHLDPKYFPEPEKFNPRRFEENIEPYTFVAFGGGPRTCPGRDYARLEILVFIHNLVKRFKWEKVIADEKIIFNPKATPASGLPVLLIPHQT
ncbi:hypothetical protein Drorol1_Dr00019706 [Drosera rotundifolia]